MALLLSESDIRGLVDMKEAVEAVENSFKLMKGPDDANSPRTRSISQDSVLNVMHASLSHLGRAGTKVYLASKNGVRFVFLLFDLKTGELLSVMGADHLGRYRTGASSAVATKHLCELRSFRLGMAGTGTQAFTQIEAMARVANLEGVFVWSPRKGRREAFAKRITGELGLQCRAKDSLGEAFQSAEVATTITSAREPFVGKESLTSILHLNACGSNWASKSEVKPEAVGSFSTVCVDDLAQSMVESGDLIEAVRQGALKWENVTELRQVVQQEHTRQGKTLFKSNGIAAEDVALASLLYDKAAKAGNVGSKFGFQ